MHSFVCPSLLCIRESAHSRSFMTFWNWTYRSTRSRTPYSSHQRLLWPDLTREGTSVAMLHSGSSKSSDKPVL